MTEVDGQLWHFIQQQEQEKKEDIDKERDFAELVSILGRRVKSKVRRHQLIKIYQGETDGDINIGDC